MLRPPPRSPLFPYTTLFRSSTAMLPAGIACCATRSMDARSPWPRSIDRKSTRLNSSHSSISYAFFFFLNAPAPPEISPLSLHDALPIFDGDVAGRDCLLRYKVNGRTLAVASIYRSEEHTSELQSQFHLVCLLFFFKCSGPPRDLPSFPTRRSSDLRRRCCRQGLPAALQGQWTHARRGLDL